MVAVAPERTYKHGYCRSCDAYRDEVPGGVCPECNRPLDEIIRIGYCRQCRRYQETDGDCPECNRSIQERLECRTELQAQYGRLLLAVQPWMDRDDEPDLFERIDQRMGWTAPVNPMFFGNANNSMLRSAIRTLRGVAAAHGVDTGPLDPKQGFTRVVSIDGEDWEVYEDARNGSMRRIRKLPGVGDDLSALPENWTGPEKRRRA